MSESTLREQLKARQLLPHQVEFVESALDSLPGGRVLLADDVGIGKTHACVSLAWALARNLGHEPRMLVLATHKALLAQWHARLVESGSADALLVDAAAYRKLEARTSHDENPWMAVQTALTTIDFAKRDDRLASLTEASWDLVILEESHRATSRSQRGKVLRDLWGSNRVSLMVAVSATPHTGKAEDFEPFTAPATRTLRRRARELRDWEGNSLIPESARQVMEVVPLELSAQEREVYEALARLVEGTDPTDRQRQFFMRVLFQRATSSLFAVEQTVRRSVVRMNLSLSHRRAQVGLFDDEPDIDDQADLWEENVSLQSMPFLRSLALSVRDELKGLLRLIDRVEVDSKWDACADLLRPEIVEGDGSALVFCEFEDTAEYLFGLLCSLDCQVGLVTGSIADAEQRRAYETFRNEGGALVVTSVASESLNLAFVKLCIHYDVPWNQAGMAQRIGRVHRYGATPGPVRHVAFSDGVLMQQSRVQKLLSLSGPASSLGDIESLLAPFSDDEPTIGEA